MSTHLDNSNNPIILLVEDRRATRLMIRNVLHSHNYQVVEAENGEEALAIVSTLMPDIILMDIVMPVMDGLAACSHIRNMPGVNPTPILMFTGLDDANSVELAFEAGATDFITKPINFEELRHRIYRLLHMRHIEELNRYRAYYDILTGLPNKLLFNDRLTMSISQSQKEYVKVAVLFLNIRNFKLINEAFGYDKGDLILKGISERLVSKVGEDITVARIGGDDFSLILNKIKFEKEAVIMAEKVLSAVQEPWIIDGQEIRLSGVVGIAISPNDGLLADELLKNAESAMYRNTTLNTVSMYQFYSHHMYDTAVERLTLENSLRLALTKDELLVYYQPQVNLTDGKVIGVEALMRWEHPIKGLVSPGYFIPIAEETGLILPFGEWLLLKACQQVSELHKLGWQIGLSVNLSTVQFQQLNLVDAVVASFKKANLDTKYLTLEITESTAMLNVDYTIKILGELKSMGIRIAIDDFGTGYSSLNYLKQLPIDELKIDRSFINDIGINPQDEAIVKAIILLSKSFNLKVVAEGIETKEHMHFLNNHQCNYGQGYLFSKPLSYPSLIDFLNKGVAL